jgi:superfamily I DNA and/or RNA helicase
MNLGAVSIGTVENYQGDERRVTILNCVRATKRFLEWDRKKGSGLVNQRRSFNVAITRAKELLVIIGNPDVLQVHL